MQRMRYIGARTDLTGRTALVRDRATTLDRVCAQFDFDKSIPLDHRGQPLRHDPLFYGWHDFDRTDFELIPGEHDFTEERI